MYGTIPSEKMPSFEMLPPVSVSTYPRTPPARERFRERRAVHAADGDVRPHARHDEQRQDRPDLPGQVPAHEVPEEVLVALVRRPAQRVHGAAAREGHDRARLGDGVIRVARVIPVSHPMALLPSPSGSHVCPSAPMPGRFITAEFTTARVMTERAGDRAAARRRTTRARAPSRGEVSARTGPYPILTLRASRRPRSAPGATARDPSDIAGVVAMLLDKAMRAAHCGRGRATRSARRRAATSHETRLVPSPTWRRSSSSAHANSLTGCDAADETCSRDCFLSVRVKATIPIAFSRRLLQKISRPLAIGVAGEESRRPWRRRRFRRDPR